MTPPQILTWLASKGVFLSIGQTVFNGNRIFCCQDGRHVEKEFDAIIERVRAKEGELMQFMEANPDAVPSPPDE